MIFGYRRVSSVEQNYARQDLESLGVNQVFEEKVSGVAADRPQWNRLTNMIRVGDTVIVWSIDRLARNLIDLKAKVDLVRSKGASVCFHKENLMFNAEASDPMSELQLNIIASFAEFERSLIRQRQAEGIAKAKAAGKYRGPPKRRDDAKIIKALGMRQTSGEGFTRSEVAKLCGVGEATVYRVIAEARKRGEIL
ncbi:MAG: recombinase family protein [Loktanella sp.]|nr:recombinase family protein [Loktanella sp.]